MEAKVSNRKMKGKAVNLKVLGDVGAKRSRLGVGRNDDGVLGPGGNRRILVGLMVIVREGPEGLI